MGKIILKALYLCKHKKLYCIKNVRPRYSKILMAKSRSGYILVFFQVCCMFKIFNNKMSWWSERPLYLLLLCLQVPSQNSKGSAVWCVSLKKNSVASHDLLFTLISSIFNVHLHIHTSTVWVYLNLYNHAHVNGNYQF